MVFSVGWGVYVKAYITWSLRRKCSEYCHACWHVVWVVGSDAALVNGNGTAQLS